MKASARSCFVAPRSRQGVGREGFLAEGASCRLFSWQPSCGKGWLSEEIHALRKQRLLRPRSEGMRGQDVCGAAERWGGTGCCQMFPGEATVPASSCPCYGQRSTSEGQSGLSEPSLRISRNTPCLGNRGDLLCCPLRRAELCWLAGAVLCGHSPPAQLPPSRVISWC